MGAPVHTLEDRERGLAALVIAGSSFRASEITGIPASTLRDWKTEHAERYEALRHELEPQVARTIAAEAEHLTQRVFAVEHKILDTFSDEDIASLKPADKASALRNLQTVAALGVDKLSSPLRERPSHVQHNTSPEELASRIARALGFTDSTATELDPADALALPSVSVIANAQDTSSGSTS